MSNEQGKRELVEVIISDYHTTRVGHDYVSHILSKRRTNQAFVSFEQDIIDRLATRPAPVGEPVAWMYERGSPWPARYIHDERTPVYLTDGEGWTETPLYTRPALDVKNLRALAKTLESWANCGFQDEDYPEAIELFSQAAATIRAAIKDATDAQ